MSWKKCCRLGLANCWTPNQLNKKALAQKTKFSGIVQVGMENITEVFIANKHPKKFVVSHATTIWT